MRGLVSMEAGNCIEAGRFVERNTCVLIAYEIDVISRGCFRVGFPAIVFAVVVPDVNGIGAVGLAVETPRGADGTEGKGAGAVDVISSVLSMIIIYYNIIRICR